MKAVAVVTLCLSAALVATGAACAEAPAADAPAPSTAAAVASPAIASFEGIWLFDAKRSDDPKKLMEQARGGAGRPGGGPPGGRPGGRGGMGPGGGGQGGPPQGMAEGEDAGAGGASSRSGGDPRRAMDRVVNPAKKMVVYVDGERFQVEEDEGSPRVYTIADSLKAQGVKALETEATVKVQGRRLEAKQPLGRRGALLETFELSEDGRSLTIRARRQGGPEGMTNPTITRVYKRYDGE